MRTKANKRSCHYKRIALAKTMPTKIAIAPNVAAKRKGKSAEIRGERRTPRKKKQEHKYREPSTFGHCAK